MSKIIKRTCGEISARMLRGESFWVGTEEERQMSFKNFGECRRADLVRGVSARYTTGSDDRGGFYVCRIVLPSLPVRK